MGAPCFHLLGELMGHELGNLDRIRVTSHASAGASSTTGKK